jgi:hypothetical protein
MSKLSIQFEKLILNSQVAGTSDEHHISRVHFTAIWPNGGKTQAYCDVKLPVGGRYESDPLEVSKPIGLKGAFSYEELGRAVESYVRRCVGSNAVGIKFDSASLMTIRDCEFAIDETARIPAKPDIGRSW